MSNTTYTATEIAHQFATTTVFSPNHSRITRAFAVTKTTSRSTKTHTVLVTMDTNESAGWRATANYNPEGNHVYAAKFSGFKNAALAAVEG